MTRLWCIQLGAVDTDEVTIYADQPGFPPIVDAIARLQAADRYVFHNGFGFDMEAINRFYPGAVVREKLFDSLVAARLFAPEERSHSLKEWGNRLKLHKGTYTGDFQSFTDDLVAYAIQDIHVGRALYHHVKEVETWGESCQLEMDVAYILIQQERNGFRLDIPRAVELEGQLRAEVAELDKELQVVFPPIPMERVWTPRVNNKKLGYVKGEPFTKRWMEVFEASSRHHVGRRLQAAGWKPVKWNDDGTPSTDEGVLSRLKHPAARLLCKRVAAAKMLAQVSDGKTGWLKIVHADGRVRGRVNPCGAVTGRMTHSSPNMANVDKDERTRSLWIPRDGWRLVGTDAEGLEARVLGDIF